MIHRLACFVSAHGFGHATRTIATLEALRQRCPEVHIELFTTVPEHLFAASLKNFTYHHLQTDVGLVQRDALLADMPATITQLEQFLRFDPDLLEQLARHISGCDGVLCDISPLGIAVAKKAKIPSILVENFTWDWIYQAYRQDYPQLAPHIDMLAELYGKVTHHVQTEPVCLHRPAALRCAPIARRIKKSPQMLHSLLATGGRQLIVISLGGIATAIPHWPAMLEHPGCFFVLAGQGETRKIYDNAMLLASNTEIYHPDLIAAAELVLCKSGYSTIAECAQSGTRVACVSRDTFPEGIALGDFVVHHLQGHLFMGDTIASGAWLQQLPDLLAKPRPKAFSANGAQAVASFLAGL